LSTSEKYFYLLGGKDFPDSTYKRTQKFYEELEIKREYQKFTTFETKLDEMIVINGIKVFSFCEHHLLPFFGYCSIGYIPDGHLLGLSKFQRLVDKIASKPTLQENITSEIADSLDKKLYPKGLGVAMTCVHTCMFGRGINTSTCTVNTQIVKGFIKDKAETRNEFLGRVRIADILR